LPATLNGRLVRASLLSFLILLPVLAAGQTHEPAGAHADPVTPVVLALAIILATAKLAGHLAVRMGQPAVLGELVAGVVLGSLDLIEIVGKQACSLGAIGRSLDRLSIDIGMIPRGEVGLIFANIGLGLSLAGQPIIDEGIFSAVVIMVIVTTMATPPLLKWSLARR
jgi:Kef-type K+ transport system membrane component KefB